MTEKLTFSQKHSLVLALLCVTFSCNNSMKLLLYYEILIILCAMMLSAN